MQHFTPYDPKIWDVLRLSEALRRAAQPMEFSFYHERVRSKVAVPTLYTLKTLMGEILQRGKAAQIEDMQAGLKSGLKHLVRAAKIDDAMKIVASIRNQFPDTKTGLSDITIEECKSDLTAMKEALRRSMATYATKDSNPKRALTFVNPKEGIKLTEAYAKASQGNADQMADFYRSLSVDGFTFCLMKLGPDEAAMRKFIYQGARVIGLPMSLILGSCMHVAKIELENSEDYFIRPGYGTARTDPEKQTMSDVLLLNFAPEKTQASGSADVPYSERIQAVLSRFEDCLIKAIGMSREEIVAGCSPTRS